MKHLSIYYIFHLRRPEITSQSKPRPVTFWIKKKEWNVCRYLRTIMQIGPLVFHPGETQKTHILQDVISSNKSFWTLKSTLFCKRSSYVRHYDYLLASFCWTFFLEIDMPVEYRHTILLLRIMQIKMRNHKGAMRLFFSLWLLGLIVRRAYFSNWMDG